MVLYVAKLKLSAFNRQRAFSIKIVSQANFTYANGVTAWVVKVWHYSHSIEAGGFVVIS